MRIVIAGGGPSLKDFDWGCLRNEFTIAVTRSFSKLPDAPIVYFTDKRFWDWYGAELLKHPGRKITVAKVNHPNVLEYRLSGTHSAIDLRKGYLKGGNNSGYAAINLAVQLGASEIFLLGYDMQNTRQSDHWHSDYAPKNRDDLYSRTMLKFFPALRATLDDMGINVVNVGLGSALNVFPKISFDQFYKEIL